MRIAYVISSPAHKRCVESFQEHPSLKQIVIGPKPTIKEDMVDGTYKAFGIKTIYQVNKISFKPDAIKILAKFSPDVYVQPDLGPIHNQICSKLNVKRVYISHGLVGNHVKSMIKQAEFNTKPWRGMDLYCGDGAVFANWISHVVKVPDSKIMLGAMPQFDILYNMRKKIDIHGKGKVIHPGAARYEYNKIILFLGFCCKDRKDFKKHNMDYFRTTIELSKLAKQYKWLLYVKPRQEQRKMYNYFQTNGVDQSTVSAYKNVVNKHGKERTYFIGPSDNHIYHNAYREADVIVVNGCSTAEVEACILGKPLVIVRTKQNSNQGYDPYDTVHYGAAEEVKDISNLYKAINNTAYSDDTQKQFLKEIKITADGNSYNRIQNRILAM